MSTRTKTVSTVTGIILLSCLIAGFLLFKDYNNAVHNGYGSPTQNVEFIIEEGTSVETIAANLKSDNLISNELYFKYYVQQSGIAGNIQAGAFSIPNNLSLEELGEILQNAVFPDIWVTIPEGMMAIDIAEAIDAAFSTNPESSFDATSFTQMITTESPTTTVDLPIPAGKSLEGFLFPDTYRFPPDASAEYVLHTILTTFRTKIYEPLQRDIADSGYSLYDVLILASILERETRHGDDRPLVADILIRRLENNWALEVDATLLYHFQDWTHTITEGDLALDSLYNTRKYPGLTPTPIANPGEETVRAVLFPQSNTYWYYISDHDGILHYATTLEEHNRNIQNYLY